MRKFNNYIYFILLSFMVVFTWTTVHARDINLDSIYINEDSELSKKLIQYKVETYERAGSHFVDRNIIFADWLNGSEIIYVKEYPKINIVYQYNRKKRRRVEIQRITGTITYSKASPNGRYLFLKLIKIEKNGFPSGKTLMLNIASKQIHNLPGNYPFLDFSLSPGGNSVIYQVKNGIIELYPESQIKKLVHNSNEYRNVRMPGSPVVAILSPNRRKSFIISGSGGNYRGKIISEHKQKKLDDISSIGEVFWLNNRSLIYRKGSPGFYTVNVFDLKSNSETRLFGPTYNTNINYSKYPRIVTFLKDQVIHVYDTNNKEIINTSLEGEDVTFTPDGTRFISLFYKKLFITKLNILQRKKVELKKPSKNILRIYKKLLKNRGLWINSFSLDYLKRKIFIYTELSN